MAALIGQLRAQLRVCQDILDVGCGSTSSLRFLPKARLVGLDGFAPALAQARQLGTHDEYIIGDVRHLSEVFEGRRFDACVALDVIEHLPKEDGWRMLDQMESLAKRRVVVFTPNGFVPQQSKDGDLQEHLSGWSVQDFEGRGYTVLGMCGPKSLRGEYHTLKYRPRLLWGLLSVIVDYTYTRSHPETAAALLAFKRIVT